MELIDKILKDILDSQSSLKQLKKGNTRIAVASLYSLERAMITGKLMNKNLNMIKASRFTRYLDKTLLQEMASGRKNYHEVLRELEIHLLKSEDTGPGYQLMKKYQDMDPDKLNIIGSIEGGHSLIGDTGSEDEILNNLEELKKVSHPLRFLYLTLTHLTQKPLCTHAYGIKFIADETFKPAGYGITSLGEKVIEKAFEKTAQSNRIFIDVKHMSLITRKQFYQMHQENYSDIPIIASHVAAAGTSWNKLPVCQTDENWQNEDYVWVRYNKPKGYMKTEFNPWSVNLYDEDIQKIIESDGLIGLNFDERILGTKQHKPEDRVEYFSKEEYRDLRADFQPQVCRKHKRRIFCNRDVKYLANNILYMVKVGGEQAWNHIAIGSDFDGLINSLEQARNAKKFNKLYRKLIRIIPKMAQEEPSVNFYTGDVESRVKQVMYENADRFLEKYYD
jgi:microsomal dipeptidase-like Zn-dependent dipeptidase